MKPVTVSIAVPNRREEVYDYLDVLANHEPFTDHMLVDWRCSGPAAGLGARARVRLKKPGRPDWRTSRSSRSARPRRVSRRRSAPAGAGARAAPTSSRRRRRAGRGSPSASSGCAHR
jgi:hypothetical protein